MSTPSQILNKIQEKIKIWHNIDSSQITVKFLPSMSNVVYLVHVNLEIQSKILENEPVRVLYREFATGLLDELINRKVENELFQFLADTGLGPKLLYVDPEIRIEEFICGTPLTGEDMIDPQSQLTLMKVLPQYHTLKPDSIKRETPFDTFIFSMRMHELIEEKRKFTDFADSENEKIDTILKTINKDFLSEIKANLNEHPQGLVVSHNDLLNGNIMRMGEDQFTLIDYEYMSFNYPGYDIANFCNECMFDYSYPHAPNFKIHKEKRPTGDNLLRLYKLYIITFDKCKKGKEFPILDSFDDHETLDALWNENPEKYSKILEKLLRLHKYNMIVSHLYWLLWAIIVSKNPRIDFDYIEFSWERFQDVQELMN